MKKMKKMVRAAVATGTVVTMMSAGLVMANDQSTWSQQINEGNLTVDIVDASGESVVSPTVTMPAKTFSFEQQSSEAVFGVDTQRVRVINATDAVNWSVSIAADDPSDTWTDGGTNSYSFNGTEENGRLTINPQREGYDISEVGSCSTDNISAGSSSSFASGTVDSITLLTAASAANFCQWEYQGAGLTQTIPAGQAAASYSITMVLSVV